MADLNIIVTNAGRAALINAANTGTAPVTISHCGVSATAVAATPATAALPGEIKRISTLSGDVVDDDTIHLIVRDETADLYTLRSIALYLQDGTLFAVYGQADPIMEKSAQAMLLLAVDVRFADIDAADLTFGDANFLNPPATTEALGVVELATEAEADTGVDTGRAVTPKAMKTAVTNWLDTRFGAGAPSAFMKTLLTAASAIALRAAIGLKSAALKDEGAGNGLDADLLDGQHGAYYADVAARLGYIPWGPSNDGSGSGMDADTVDGRHANEFALLSGAIFSGNVTAPSFHSSGTGDEGLRARGAAPYVTWYNAAGSSRFGYMQHLGVGGNLLIVNEMVGGVALRAGGADRIIAGYNGNVGIGQAPDALAKRLAVRSETSEGVGIVVAAGGTFSSPALNIYDGNVNFCATPIGSSFNVGTFSSHPLALWSGNSERVRITETGILLIGRTQSSISGGNGATVQIGSGAGSAGMTIHSSSTGTGDVQFADGLTGDMSYRGLLRYDHGADLMSIWAGGASRLYINATGLGVGVSPSHTMDVAGGIYSQGSAAELKTQSRNGADTWTRYVSSGVCRWNNGTDRMTLNAAGDLSITGLMYAGGYFVGGSALAGGTAAEKVLYAGTSFLHILKHDGSTAYVTLNNTTGGVSFTGSLTAGGSLVWTAGNDGSGSGMDADMLDGLHASDFARVVASSYTATGGYRVWSDGFKECWGNSSVGGNSTGSVTYPVSMTSWSKAFVNGGYSSGGKQDNGPFATSTSTGGLSVFNALDVTTSFTWHAFGY